MSFPIIALWAHPRSMSTATERVMRERGDLDCAHEPFMYDYYVERGAGVTPHFDVQEDHPAAYDDIRDMLLRRAETRGVFFKDMSYYVMPRLLEDARFRDRVRHAFLIRNPEAAIASYHRLDPNFSEEEIGITAQWEHYDGLCAAGHDPVVLISETIRDAPAREIGRWWRSVGLGAAPHAFEWEGDAIPDDWEQVGAWHGAVSQSTGIRPMEPGHEARAHEKFERAAEEAPHLRDWLARLRGPYERLRAVAERQQAENG